MVASSQARPPPPDTAWGAPGRPESGSQGSNQVSATAQQYLLFVCYGYKKPIHQDNCGLEKGNNTRDSDKDVHKHPIN